MVMSQIEKLYMEYKALQVLAQEKKEQWKYSAALERYCKEKEQQRSSVYAANYERVHGLLQGWAYQRRIRVYRTSKGYVHYQGIKFKDAEGKYAGQSQAWDMVDGTVVRQSRNLGTTTIILLMLQMSLPRLHEFQDIDLGTTEKKEYHLFEIYIDNRDLYDNFD